MRGRGTELGEDLIELAMVLAAGQLIVMPLHRLMSSGEEPADLRVRRIVLAAFGAVVAGAALGWSCSTRAR